MLSKKIVLLAILGGLLVAVTTGYIENPPEASIIGATYYGYPFVWRVIIITLPLTVNLIYSNLISNIVIWASVLYIISFTLNLYSNKSGRQILNKKRVTILALVLPLGLIMDLLHELGHALWGTIVGGKLTYMQIAFLELFPNFTFTSKFVLGLVRVEGITGFNFGVFLLGGVVTTNIVSWLVGLFLLRRQLSTNIRLCCKIFGLFGLLDLPFYVILPQIGFRHWFFVGGSQPEPLIGARMMGIPDFAFYTFVILTSLGLTILYSQSIRKHIQEIYYVSKRQ